MFQSDVWFANKSFFWTGSFWWTSWTAQAAHIYKLLSQNSLSDMPDSQSNSKCAKIPAYMIL